MRIACLQMDVQFGCPEQNFQHAENLIAQAMQDKPDVLVLPETWNTGFFPRENLQVLCDQDGTQVKARIGALAKQFCVNIVAGSVSDFRNGRVWNTAYIFDRQGACIASYDKTHLFTPMGEDAFYEKGQYLCTFSLDGIRCGLMICYDIRFPELSRTLALQGMDMLFVVSQWPKERISHLRLLTAARAVENQLFLICCNACGHAGDVVFGGNSAVIDPRGKTLALAGEQEKILSADCNLSLLTHIRSTIPVFQDRNPELYRI